MLSVEISRVPVRNMGTWHSQSNMSWVLNSYQPAHVRSGDLLSMANRGPASKRSHITKGRASLMDSRASFHHLPGSPFVSIQMDSPIFNSCNTIWNYVLASPSKPYHGWFLFTGGLFLQGRYPMIIVTQSWCVVGSCLQFYSLDVWWVLLYFPGNLSQLSSCHIQVFPQWWW